MLFYIPDYGESAFNTGHLFKRFAQAGIRSFSIDRKGFGLSQGQRGYKDERLFENQWNFIDSVGFLRGFPKNLPKFLLASGYGGLLAVRFMEQRPDHFDGAILVNPLLAFKTEYDSFSLGMMRVKAYT